MVVKKQAKNGHMFTSQITRSGTEDKCIISAVKILRTFSWHGELHLMGRISISFLTHNERFLCAAAAGTERILLLQNSQSHLISQTVIWSGSVSASSSFQTPKKNQHAQLSRNDNQACPTTRRELLPELHLY